MKQKNSSNETVTLTLTKQEYRDLLKSMFLAEWFANSWRNHEEPKDTIANLEQKIYAHAEEAGLLDWIEYDESLKSYFPTEEMENDLFPHIDEYNENNFWTVLIQKFSERDFLQTYGEEKIATMEMEDIITAGLPFFTKYQNEFEEHGIDRLRLPLTLIQKK